MTYFLNLKNLSQKCHTLLTNLGALPTSSHANTARHISQWDPAFQIPAYIRKAHKKPNRI